MLDSSCETSPRLSKWDNAAQIGREINERLDQLAVEIHALKQRAADSAVEEALVDAGLHIGNFTYSTAEVCDILRKSRTWVWNTYHRGGFVSPGADGTAICPVYVGSKWYWKATDVRDIAITWYHKGHMNADELKRIVRRLIVETAVYDPDYLRAGR